MNENANKKVIANSFIYSISGLFLKCIGLFTMPLYTAYLTTADYGVTSIASSFITTMGYIAGFSLFSAIMRFYVDLKENKEKLKRFYGSVVVFTLLSCAVWTLLLTFFQAPLSKYVFSGINYYPVIFVCLLTLIFNIQHTIYTNILKSQQKALKDSILSILYFLVGLALNVFFVVFLKMGAIGALYATLISDFLFFIYFIADMLRMKAIHFCLDFSLLKEALKYSIPIMPHNLSTQIAMLISKALLGGTSSLASLGLYSVASQFGNMADVVQSYVNNAYAPWLYEKLHSREEQFKQTIRGTVNLLTGVIGVFMLGISLFAQDYIVLFLEKSYVSAWKFVPLIVLVFAIKIMYYFYVNVLFYYKKASRVLFVATLSGSFLNILLSAYCIPKFGAYGSIAADAIAMVVRVAIITLISLKYEKIGLRVTDFVINFFVLTAFIAAAMLPSYLGHVGNTFHIWYFLYKITVVLAYVVWVFIRNRKQFFGSFAQKFLKKFSWRKS